MDDVTSHPLFRHAPVAVSLLDLDLNQVAANERFAELFGYEPGTSLTSSQLTLPEDDAMTRAYIADVIAEKHPPSIEKRYVRADGSIFWGRLTAELVRFDGEALLMGVIEDIQPQHDLLESLAESMREAQAQSEMRSRFVAQVSHELRNPLHLIAGTSELIGQADIPMKERQRAASILAEATSLAAVVDDLLDLGRGDAGQLTLHEAPFSMRSLIHRVRQTMAPVAATKGLALAVSVDDRVAVHVLGDEGRLRQILVNLVSNAVKFTSRGSVTLDVDLDLDGHTRFRVVDTGPGIPTEGLDSIFEPFVRLSRAESGAGLGLAISSRLANLMGGSLSATNIEPRGAQFELCLPLVETTGEAPQHARDLSDGPPMPTEPQHGHVLIVEDSRENQLLAVAQLDALGYTSDLAGDGYEALDALRESSYDAVLMDWHMPGLNGLETTRRIREIEQHEGVARQPIIALTARTMAADIEACFDAGVDDHVSKPAGLDDLRRVLGRWIATESDEMPIDDADDVDRSTLLDLFDNLGDVELVGSILTTYLEQLDDRVQRIVSSGDRHELESAAHVLASTSKIVGATALSELARAIEDQARSDHEVAPDMIEELEGRAAHTAVSLRDEFERLKGNV